MKKQLSYLYLSIRDLVAPLEESLSSIEGLEYLFDKYGWEVDLDEQIFTKINQVLVFKDPLNNFIKEADILIDKLRKEEIGLSDLKHIIEQGKNLIQLIAKLDIENITELDKPLNNTLFWTSISDHLFDDLLASYLKQNKPVPHGLLQFFGVIRYEQVEPEAAFRKTYTRTVLDWPQLLELITNPFDAFKNYYKWGLKDQNFRHLSLLQNARKTLESIRLSSEILVPPSEFLNNVQFNPSQEYNIEQEVMDLFIPFSYGINPNDDSIVELGLSIIPMTEDSSTSPTGLLLSVVSRGSLHKEIVFNNNFRLDWKIGTDASNLLQLKVFPGKAEFDIGDINVNRGFAFRSTFKEPLYLFGNKDTTRIELQGVSLEGKVLGTAIDPETILSLKLQGNPGLNTVIHFDDIDEFLKDTVAKKPMEAGFSPEIIWSSKNGITLNGNTSFKGIRSLQKEVLGIVFKNFILLIRRS